MELRTCRAFGKLLKLEMSLANATLPMNVVRLLLPQHTSDSDYALETSKKRLRSSSTCRASVSLTSITDGLFLLFSFNLDLRASSPGPCPNRSPWVDSPGRLTRLVAGHRVTLRSERDELVELITAMGNGSLMRGWRCGRQRAGSSLQKLEGWRLREGSGRGQPCMHE